MLARLQLVPAVGWRRATRVDPPGEHPWRLAVVDAGVQVVVGGLAQICTGAVVGQHWGCPVGRLAGGMGGVDMVRPLVAGTGVCWSGCVRSPPPPFLGRVREAATLAIFEAGRLLLFSWLGAAGWTKAKAFGWSWGCLDAWRRP